MKKINKRSVLTVVLALMLVLSAGFYTGLNPTTAWFHQEDSEDQTYNVGTFEVDFSSTVHANMNLTFDVTTKLSEALETAATDAADRNTEFEYAVKYIYVTIENNVESDRTDADYLDALVKLKVGEAEEGEGDSGSALRYYYFALDPDEQDGNQDANGQFDEVSIGSDGTAAAGGSIASALQTYCTTNSISDDDDFIDPSVNPQMNFDDLDDDADPGLIRVPHNGSVTVCIALWVHHGESGVTNTTFPVTVSMNARQALADD